MRATVAATFMMWLCCCCKCCCCCCCYICSSCRCCSCYSGFCCCLWRRQRAGIVCLAVTRRMRNELTYLHSVQVCQCVPVPVCWHPSVRGHVLLPQLGILTVEFWSSADNCRVYVMLRCCNTETKHINFMKNRLNANKNGIDLTRRGFWFELSILDI